MVRRAVVHILAILLCRQHALENLGSQPIVVDLPPAKRHKASKSSIQTATASVGGDAESEAAPAVSEPAADGAAEASGAAEAPPRQRSVHWGSDVADADDGDHPPRV